MADVTLERLPEGHDVAHVYVLSNAWTSCDAQAAHPPAVASVHPYRDVLLVVTLLAQATWHGTHLRPPLDVVTSYHAPVASAGGQVGKHSNVLPPNPTSVVVLTDVKKLAHSGSPDVDEI